VRRYDSAAGYLKNDCSKWYNYRMFRRLHGRLARYYPWLLAGLALAAAGILLGSAFGWRLTAASLLALTGWAAAFYWRVSGRRREQRVRARLDEVEQRRAEVNRRLQAAMRLTRGLAEAQDEKALMDAALSALTSLVGALGCSFVPVDDWDQPLPAFTYGQLPEPVLSAWATHLASGNLRRRCASCSVLESAAGMCPLHPAEVGSAMSVYCLPLRRASEPPAPRARTLGLLNLYLPAGHTLDPDMRVFLDGLLREIALAYENAHMRAQELSTLRHLQLMHLHESDFGESLGSLLEGLKQALEADCVLVRLRPSADERLSNLVIRSGGPCWLDDRLEEILDCVLRSQTAASEPEELPVWLALPLALPEGQVLGILAASAGHGRPFHPRQKAILQTVASQAALLVDNERLIRSLEYRVVIQERARLAREIHDGLAQTLAFLKLQAAQMQTYLAHSDLGRLSEVLKDNYQALAEAYLDTRQAIDNLRLTPEEGLTAWLERILNEFENTTGLLVERTVQPEAVLAAQSISPEIQAQLIRIVQESLSNVRKHARAGRVWVRLNAWQDELVFEICDDGQGFESHDVPDLSRYGLRGMRERAELIGADFQITSQAGQGTVMRLALPVTLGEGTPQ